MLVEPSNEVKSQNQQHADIFNLFGDLSFEARQALQFLLSEETPETSSPRVAGKISFVLNSNKSNKVLKMYHATCLG